MPDPLFSIIVPTYNAAPKLKKTLVSIFAQPDELFECIVVDGGSSDDTATVASEWGKRLKFVSEKDRGVYDAMNKGITLSRGRFLYFIGAGDTLRPGILAQVANFAIGDGPILLYGDVFAVNAQKRIRGQVTRSMLRRYVNICHQAIFTSRDVFGLTGVFDLKYKMRADNVLNIKAFGDERIQKQWLDLVIADYEGGGLSDRYEDKEFQRDFPRHIREHFGRVHYVFYLFEASRRSMMRKLGLWGEDVKSSSSDLI